MVIGYVVEAAENVVDWPFPVLVHEQMMHCAALDSGAQRADHSVREAVVLLKPDHKEFVGQSEVSAFDQVDYVCPANHERWRKMLHLMAVIVQVANAEGTGEVSAQVIFSSQMMELVAKAG